MVALSRGHPFRRDSIAHFFCSGEQHGNKQIWAKPTAWPTTTLTTEEYHEKAMAHTRASEWELKERGEYMVKLQKIGVLSSVKVYAVLMASLGLIAGILYSFGGAAIDVLVSAGWMTSSETPGLSYGTLLAFAALIGMPVLFSLAGSTFAGIMAILYNLVAGRIGGIELELEQVDND